VPLHQPGVKAPQPGIAAHAVVEAAQQWRAQGPDLLDQLVACRQPERRTQPERRVRQQLREPGVEGQHLHAGGGLQHPQRQRAQRTGLRGGRRRVEPALDQRLRARGVAAPPEGIGLDRKGRQPLLEPGTHLAGGLARERDGDDLRRLGPVEQRTQDARHQQPGLAGARTGLDDDAAPRVAGGRVEGLARHRPTVDRVGGRGQRHGRGR